MGKNIVIKKIIDNKDSMEIVKVKACWMGVASQDRTLHGLSFLKGCFCPNFFVAEQFFAELLLAKNLSGRTIVCFVSFFNYDGLTFLVCGLTFLDCGLTLIIHSRRTN